MWDISYETPGFGTKRVRAISNNFVCSKVSNCIGLGSIVIPPALNE